MAHKKSLEALNFTLKDLRRNNNIFGGLMILLAGDFRQTLPVVPRGTPADELNACLKASPLWNNNNDVHALNFTIQSKIAGDLVTYKSVDSITNPDDVVNYPTEFLNSLEIPGFPPHNLQLKVGTVIMILRNLNPPRLCNGTRLS
ncbi:hypothetical protein EVAR_82020_1, partial [Eumeta japonica]